MSLQRKILGLALSMALLPSYCFSATKEIRCPTFPSGLTTSYEGTTFKVEGRDIDDLLYTTPSVTKVAEENWKISCNYSDDDSKHVHLVVFLPTSTYENCKVAEIEEDKGVICQKKD